MKQKGRSSGGKQVKAAVKSAPAAKAEAKPDVKVSSVYHVPDEDKKILSDLDRELGKTKNDIASITMQIESAMTHRSQMIAQANQVAQKYQETVSKAAEKCGLDLKNSSWNFDPIARTFSPTL